MRRCYGNFCVIGAGMPTGLDVPAPESLTGVAGCNTKIPASTGEATQQRPNQLDRRSGRPWGPILGGAW